MAFEYVQRGRLYNLYGQPVPVFYHLPSHKFAFLQMFKHCFWNSSFCPLPLVLSLRRVFFLYHPSAGIYQLSVLLACLCHLGEHRTAHKMANACHQGRALGTDHLSPSLMLCLCQHSMVLNCSSMSLPHPWICGPV